MSEGRVPPSSFKVDRRWSLAALLLAAVLVALLVAASVFTNTRNAPAPAGETTWQQIVGGITADSVPTQVALEAFAYVFGAAIPGVTVPTGSQGGDEPTSGTGVVRWVQAHWNEITSDQQNAISAVIGPHAGDVVGHPTLPGAPAALFTPAMAHVGRRRAGAGVPGDAPSSALQSAMSNELVADVEHLGPKLGIATINTSLFQLFPDISLTFSDQQPGDSLFLTQGIVNAGGVYTPCNVTAWHDAWATESATASGVSDRLHVLMTHEVVHCYQNVVFGSVDTALAMPPWITEGTALWLAADDTKIAEPMIPSMWKNGYFHHPERPLTNRSYDAFGWYALYDHVRPGTLWSLMKPAWQAAASSGQRSDAFMAVLNGDDESIRAAWAPSYTREDGWNDPWIAYGFGLPADAFAQRVPAHASAEPGTNGELESRSNQIFEVQDADGEVVGVATSGIASVHDEEGTAALNFQVKRFCVSDKGCVCPPGTLLAGQNMAPDHISLPFIAAFDAPEGGSDYAIVSVKLDDLCGRTQTPQPSVRGTPCQTSCGSSNGDPHLRTINHYRYDFQGAGEFVLLHNADSSVEIQARQEPYVGAATAFRGVSINTAIAARVNGHKVSVYAGQDGLVLHVDGAQINPSAIPDLGAGASAKAVTGGFEIDLPDSSIVWALGVGIWGINAIVQPSDALRESGTGLLGPITPGGMGVPALPDGTQLPAAPDFDTRHSVLYGQFADAWRVSDATTLFDYDPGKSTANYTDRNFPSNADDAAVAAAMASPDPARQSVARSACAEISDEELQGDCIFDVYATGDEGFAQQYSAQQDLYDSGIAPETPAPPTNGPAAGVQKVVELQDLVGATIGPDDTLYISMDTATGANELLAVDPTSAAIKQQVQMRVATKLLFAADSVWAAGQTTDANGQHCSVTRYDPQTLATVGDYPIRCTGFEGAPRLFSMGDAVWFVDTTRTDPNTGSGTVLTRIDPSTNAPGISVPLPQPDGCCQDSQGAIFCYCGNLDEWRLTGTDSAFVDLGNFTRVFPAGTGFWTEQGDSALFVDAPGGPSVTIPFSDPLLEDRVVGGDPSGVYVQGEPPDTPLSRVPADGGPPVRLTDAPKYGSGISETDLDYLSGAFPWFATPRGYLHLWMFKETPDSALALWLQWAPLP